MTDWPDSDERFVQLLLQDVRATLGETHCTYVAERAAEISTFEISDPATKLIDDVQQYAHDLHIDTTWPCCPHHPHHPLWYKDGWWWCTRENVRMVPLGGLPARGLTNR